MFLCSCLPDSNKWLIDWLIDSPTILYSYHQWTEIILILTSTNKKQLLVMLTITKKLQLWLNYRKEKIHYQLGFFNVSKLPHTGNAGHTGNVNVPVGQHLVLLALTLSWCHLLTFLISTAQPLPLLSCISIKSYRQCRFCSITVILPSAAQPFHCRSH